MSKISVIIPVYNAEKQIEQCLDSVVEQTTKEEIEIIVINDGSTDESEKVILSYKIKHPKAKIKYFSKKNEGIAKTRNFGIEKASSEYILFLDADDQIEKEMIETLMPYIDKGIELIKFKLQRVNQETKEIIEKVDGPVFEKTTGEEAFNKLYSQDNLLDSPCLYIIKKELLKRTKLEFKRTYHEDFGLIPLLIISSKSIVSTPYYFYQYIQVQNSITRNNDYKKTILKMKDAIAHYDNMIKTISNLKLQKRTEENVKIYYTNAIILKLKELEEEDQTKFIKEIKKRKMTKNIKVKNLKQLIKRIILNINIKLYLKMR